MHEISGRKGGSSSSGSQPKEQPDDLQSAAIAHVLMALGEGEFAGGLTDETIFLDGTPLKNSDGTENFPGVTWEMRTGTQAQPYIPGMPGAENEIQVGTEIRTDVAWTRTFNNLQLSGLRLRLSWPGLFKQGDDNGLGGYSIAYVIELQTDGGSWEKLIDTAVTGKTTNGYERSHRINLPKAHTSWTVRLRRITPNANSAKIGDVMKIQSYTECIDAKFRYPHTALLYLRFDSRYFNGSLPQISCEPMGRVVRVPSNYDANSRTYTGMWDGTFKWAWTNNPAWVFYDIVLSERFGLGIRLGAENLDKWTLYQVAQYCDQLIPDGKGGDGMEPRHTCDVYVQDRNHAWNVVRDFVAIFRGMTCWTGDQLLTLADMPRDVDFVYSRANVINGKFTYSSTTSNVRYTTALVSWSDPANAYADAMEPAFEPDLVQRFGFNKLEVTAIGCVRQSEAHRKGRWAILTNNKDRVVSFGVGLDGNIPLPGYVVGISDEMLSGRITGGRLHAAFGTTLELDRAPDAKTGDRLIVNLPSGEAQARTITAISGKTVTVATRFGEEPQAECAWLVESTELYAQQYRVLSVADNNDGTFTITGVAHDPDKYARVDLGAVIDDRPISVVPTTTQVAPENIKIGVWDVISQGINIQTMFVEWDAAEGAIDYEAQWKRNDNNWVNVPRSSVRSFEVPNIYSGRYQVRVRAINATENSSIWAYSELVDLNGKVGAPLAPVGLSTSALVHACLVSWYFPAESGDTLKTELQYATTDSGTDAVALSDVPYPQNTYTHPGLAFAQSGYYRARLVDRSGNESPWSPWVLGSSSDNLDEYFENLDDAFRETDVWKELDKDITDITNDVSQAQDAIESHTDEIAEHAREIAENAQAAIDNAQAATENAQAIAQETADRATADAQEASDRAEALQQEANDRAAAIAAEAAIRAGEISATAKKASDDVLEEARIRAEEVAATAKKAADDILAEATARADAIAASAKKAADDVLAEASARDTAISTAAKKAADDLLVETRAREADIATTNITIQGVNDSLARQISQVAAGTGEQFDPLTIWYFDTDNDGWTEDDNGNTPMAITDDGWLTASNSAASCRSPNGLAINTASYRFIKLRIKKVGTPGWNGKLWWIGTDETGWQANRCLALAQPEYNSEGVGTLTVQDVPWLASINVRRFRFDFAVSQDANNYYLIDWIAVGRPTPGASTAALQDETTARTTADAAEATARETLAAQVRGSYEGSDAQFVTSGLIHSERQLTIGRESAIASSVTALETEFNENAAAVQQSIGTLTDGQNAHTSAITGMQTSLNRRTLMTATSRGNGSSAAAQLQAEDGTRLVTGGRSYCLVTFRKNDNGSVAVASSVLYDVFAGTANGDAFNAAVASLPHGTDVIVFTGDDPSTNRSSIYTGIEMLGGTRDIVQTVPYRGAYVLLGRKGLLPGDGLELRSTAGGTQEAIITVSLEFLNGVLQGLGGAGGAMLKSTANASAITSLDTRVTSAEGTITSQGSAITKLTNDLAATDETLAKKADATALGMLDSRVTTAEGEISSQGTALTSLNNSLTTLRRQGTNPWFDGTLESYENGQELHNAKLVVTTEARYQDTKSLKSIRVAGEGGNSDKYIGDLIAVRGGSKFRIEYWAMMAADQAPAVGWSTVLGLNTYTADGTQGWYSGAAVTENALGARGTWVKFSSVVKIPDLATKARVWVANRGANGAGTPGYVVYMDNVVITDVTDAAAAQETADANASALSTLSSAVSMQGDTITSQGSSITQLQNDLGVTNQEVAKKASATALTALENTVTQQGNNITSQGTSITSLNNSVGALQADLDVMNLMPGNLMANFSFERGQAGWTGWSSVSTIMTASNPHSGTQILRTGTGLATLAQTVPVVQGRTYMIGAFIRCTADAVVDSLGNNKLRIGTASLLKEVQFTPTELTLATWKDVNSTWKATLTGTVNVSINSSLKAGYQYFDDFYFIDITDQLAIDANASAIGVLDSRVTTAEGTITSQGSSITQLKNDLTSTNADVAKKASQTAVDALTGRVTATETGITAANSSITTLNSALTAAKANSGDLIPNPTFDPQYNQMGYPVVASTSDGVPEGCPFAYVAKLAGRDHVPAINAFPATAGDVIELSVLVACAAGGVSDFNLYVGSSASPAGSLGAPLTSGANTKPTTTWTRRTWRFTITADMMARGYIKPFLQISQNSPYATTWYATDWHCRNITAAAKAQVAADANASALSDLSTTVSTQGNTITSQGAALTQLRNDLTTTQGNVDKKADSTALTALDSRVTSNEGAITSQANALTQLENNLVNGKAKHWLRQIYAITASSGSYVPTLADLKGHQPVSVTEEADAVKIDFTSFGSYTFAYFKALVYVATAKTVACNPGARVVDDCGRFYINGVEVLSATSATTAVSLELKAGWNTIEVVIQQWTGQAYLNLGLKLSDNVDQLYSGAGVMASAAASQGLTSRVESTEAGLDATNTSLTTLATQVDSQRELGENLVANWDFRNGLDSWLVQSSNAIWGEATGDGGPGVTMNNKGDGTAPGLFVNGSTWLPVNPSRRYRFSIRAKLVSGSGQMLCRVFPVKGSQSVYIDAYLSFTDTSAFQTLTLDTPVTPAATRAVRFALYRHSGTGVVIVDSLSVIDVTDVLNISTNASAISGLTTRVTTAEGTISSQGTSITQLNNSLTATNAEVAKKAEAAALTLLQNTVTQQGKDLTSHGTSITTLENTVSGIKIGAQNILLKSDRTAAPVIMRSPATNYTGYDFQVPDEWKQKSLPAKSAFTLTMWFKKSDEFVMKAPFTSAVFGASSATGDSWSLRFYAANGTILEDGPYFRFSCTITPNAGAILFKNPTMLRIVCEDSGRTTGCVLYKIQLEEGDRGTDWGPNASEVQGGIETTNANASAIGVLESRVTTAEGTITSQGSSITQLKNDLTATNTTVAKKADSTALSALDSRVTSAEGKVTSQGTAITQLQGSITAGDNLVHNPDMLNGGQGWTKVGVETIDGYQAVYATTGYAPTSERFTVTAGEIIDFAVSLQVAVATSTRAGLRFDGPTVSNKTAYPDNYTFAAGETRRIERKGIVVPDGCTTCYIQADNRTAGIKVSMFNPVITRRNAGQQVNASAISTLDATVTQHGNTLTSQATSITKLDTSLSDLRVGGANLLHNTDTFKGSGYLSTETYLGDAVVYRKRVAGSPGYTQVDEWTIDVTGRTDFVYSFYAKGAFDGQKMSCFFYSPNTTIRTETCQGGITNSASGYDGKATLELTTKWARYWVKWSQSETTGNKKIILGRLDNVDATRDQEIFLCRPQLEVGNLLSDWSPNSDDVQGGIDANASAITSLSSRVTSAEGTITSQGTSITQLRNDLTSTNAEVAKKASQTAVDTLSGRVTVAESGITATNSRVTELNTALSAANASGGDLIPNPTFDPLYSQMGFAVVETTSDGVPAGCQYKYAAKITGRDHQANFNPIPCAEGDVFEISAWVACGAGGADFNLYIGTATQPTGGVSSPLATGGNVKAANATGWVKTTWNCTIGATSAARGYFRPFLQINQSSPFGTIWYVTDWHCRNITAANRAQSTANANASAIGVLNTTVTNQGNTITSQGDSLTQLTNNLAMTTADIDASGKVPGNLIINPSFERGTEGYTGWNALATVQVLQVPHYGTRALKLAAGGTVGVGQNVDMVAGRTYRVGAWAKQDSGTVIQDGANTKFRIADPSLLASYQYPTLSGSWQEISFTWKATKTASLAVQITAWLSAGAMYFEDFYVVDITDEVNIAGNATALTGLSSRVTAAEGSITSQGSSITQLKNDLTATNSAVAKKADSTALSALDNRVTSAEGKITAQGDAVTQLDSNIQQVMQGAGNLLMNGTFMSPMSSWSLPVTTIATAVWGATSGEGGKPGLTMTKLTAGNPSTIRPNNGQVIAVRPGSKLRITARGRGLSGAANLLFRVKRQAVGTTSVGTTSSDVNNTFVFATSSEWQTKTADIDMGTYGVISVELYPYPDIGSVVLSELSVVDITALAAANANSTAISSLTTRVTDAEGTITSQGSAITSLNSSLSTLKNQAANPWFDGSLESYTDGFQLGGNTATVSTEAKYAGGKSLRLRRLTGDTGNSDKTIGTRNTIRENAVYRFECWAMMPASEAPTTGWTTVIGLNVQDAAGVNSWQGAITINETLLGARDKWVKFSGKIALPGGGRTRALVWISTRGASGGNGYTMYLDEIVITDVTDAAAAQSTADSTASALTVLDSRVTASEGNITSQGQAMTQLKNSLTLGNLILNGQLSGNVEHWLSSGSGSGFAFNTADPALITTTASIRVANETRIPIEAGEVVTVTLDMRATEKLLTTSADSIGLISSWDNSVSWIALSAGYLSGLTTSWETRTITIEVPANFVGTYGWLRLAAGGWTPGTARLLVRNVIVSTSTGIVKKADASAVTALTTRVTTVEGKVTAQATQITGITSRVDGAESAVSSLNETVAASGLAMANGFQQVRTQIGDNSASITQIDKAVTDLDKSTAERINQVNSTVGDMSATVQQTSSTVADLNGKLTAQWGVKVQTDTGGGNPRVAGIQLGINADGSSAFAIDADQFAIYNAAASGGKVLAFMVSGSQAYLRSAMIQDATITNAKIQNGAITNAKISGLICSDNFNSDSTGWGINKNGDCIFSNGVFRGHIEAKSGTFSGTVQAQNFVGDVCNMGVGSDLMGTGGGDLVKTVTFVDSVSSGTDKSILLDVMVYASANAATSITVQLTINGNTRSYTLQVAAGVATNNYFNLRHGIRGVWDQTVTGTVRIIGANTVGKGIYAPTLTITRGSGAFSG